MKNKMNKYIINISIFLLSLVWWVPIIWMIVVSFKPKSSNTVDVTQWFIPPFTLDNYKYVLSNSQAAVHLWLLNSLIIAVISTIIILILCSFTAFAFSRINFFGKSFFFWFIMASLMIPGETILIPLYIQFRDLNILNTYTSLILPGIASPFGVIILKQFFDGLPQDLFDAAKIDGCGWITTMMKIALPLSKSSLSALGIFVFLGSWNNFLWPYITITEPKLMTVPVGLPFFKSQYNDDMAYPMAAGALAAIPMLVAFFMLQKHIIKGITFSGIKA